MKKILFVILMLLLSTGANAQIINLKGSATIKVPGPITADDKERAMTAASMNAIERYFSEKGEAQDQVFENNQEKIQQNLEKLVENTVILAEQPMPETNRYQMAVRIELNEARLKNIIKQGTAAATASSGEKSNIVYLFIARQANSVKAFDGRVVKIDQVSAQRDVSGTTKVNGSEGEKISGSQVSTNTSKSVTANADLNVSVKRESGGSVTNKADEIGFQILPMAANKLAVTSIFTQSGFSVLDSDFVLSEIDTKNIDKDFSSGSDISPGSMKNVVKTLKASKEVIKYLVIATIDVGLGSVDPSSGMKRVGTEISGRVISVEGGIPREIASVPPVQQASLGVDEGAARTAALKKGAEAASREIIAQLNNLGIK